jgi:hypothetical protein
MLINTNECNRAMLKIARVELKKRHDKIIMLEEDIFQHKVDKRILYVIIAFLILHILLFTVNG